MAAFVGAGGGAGGVVAVSSSPAAAAAAAAAAPVTPVPPVAHPSRPPAPAGAAPAPASSSSAASAFWSPEKFASEIEAARQALAAAHAREISAHRRRMTSLAWDPTGARLAGSTDEKSAIVWTLDPAGGGGGGGVRREIELAGHGAAVEALCWNPSARDTLATVSERVLRVWDVRSAQKCAETTLPADLLHCDWRPDGSVIAVVSKPETVSAVDARTWRIVGTQDLYSRDSMANEMRWDPSSRFCFVATGHGRKQLTTVGIVEVLEGPELALRHSFAAHPAMCQSVRFDRAGRYFAVGADDALLSLWDLADVVCLRTFALDGPVRSFDFSHDGALIAAASGDKSVALLPVNGTQSVHSVPAAEKPVSVVCHPRELLVAYVTHEPGVVHVFGHRS